MPERRLQKTRDAYEDNGPCFRSVEEMNRWYDERYQRNFEVRITAILAEETAKRVREQRARQS